MLTSREIASLFLLAGFAALVASWPQMRRSLAPHIPEILRTAFAGKLVVAYVLILVAVTASTTIAYLIGLWDISLVKDTFLLTMFVVFPMTFRSFTFSSGEEMVRRLVTETLGLTALLTFYLDATPMPLWAEISTQIVSIFSVIMVAFAGTKAECRSVRNLFQGVLIVVGLALIATSVSNTIQSPPDWSAFFQSLLFSFWLPLSLLPFFYIFGFAVVTESMITRFKIMNSRLTFRRLIAVMVGCRFRLGLLQRLDGRYSHVANGARFREGLHEMNRFRLDIQRLDDEEAERLAALARNTGRRGTDSDGFHQDRREFHGTKEQLDYIWGTQQGQFERLGNRYWDDLTDIIVSPAQYGLPEHHGFVIEAKAHGQAWRAWRETPGGAVLGIGGTTHRSRFLIQADAPPRGWPGESPEWVNADDSQAPPDWAYDDSSRL